MSDKTPMLESQNADASLFKVGTALSEEVFSYLAPHLPVEELLQDTSSSSETEVNHHSSCPPEPQFRNELAPQLVEEELCPRATARVVQIEEDEKLYISKWVVDASGRDAVVAHQFGARTVKFGRVECTDALHEPFSFELE
ncbi:hypothetical protein K435DRAFT_878166 [Dendrothele bispora CBS 962.96]|uniref:Uncharacterized protein n=1 Tax=Dendrothele bispora (strain CBS 962.96) TaxID=1314807 RepID=A0A4S8KNF2_DENBC|nr:hypothetical protein K435DRAFT_878166 [Dendrothele bispora CBS 962.96]